MKNKKQNPKLYISAILLITVMILLTLSSCAGAPDAYFQSEIDRLEEENRFLKENNEKLVEEIEEIKQRGEEVQEQYEAVMEENDSLSSQIQTLTAKLSELEEDYQSLSLRFQDLMRENEELVERNREMQAVMDEVYATQKKLFEKQREELEEEEEISSLSLIEPGKAPIEYEDLPAELRRYVEKSRDFGRESMVLFREDPGSEYAWIVDSRVNASSADALFLYIGKREEQKPLLRVILNHSVDSVASSLSRNSFVLLTDSAVYYLGGDEEDITREAAVPPLIRLDLPVTTYIIDMLKDLLESERCRIALSGEALIEGRNIGILERKALSNMLYSYQSMGGVLTP